MRRSRRCERRSTPIRPDGGSAAGMRASPKCRPTSSARSASPTTSSRHDGTRAVVSSPASSSWKPSAVSVSTCRFGSTATPSSAFTRAGRWRTLRAGRSPPRRSTSPGRTRPAPIFAARCARRSSASGPAAMSAPRSKRCDASVCMPSARAARRMASGSHQAASSATSAVASWISLEAPPMMPASASAGSPPLPAITPTRPGSVRSWPSSVVSVSPSRDQRTTSASPGTRARSKAWLGWPSSIIT